MNSLEELAIEHGIKESHYIRGDEYIFTIEQLESLINEVISQRLGEPVAEVAMKKFADFMPPQPYLKWHQPDHEIGTKLYALNIES